MRLGVQTKNAEFFPAILREDVRWEEKREVKRKFFGTKVLPGGFYKGDKRLNSEEFIIIGNGQVFTAPVVVVCDEEGSCKHQYFPTNKEAREFMFQVKNSPNFSTDV